MNINCSSCQEIIYFEEALKKSVNDLVEKVNSLCADVRAKNKERWEKFAYLVNLPVIGNIIYELFRAPAGLEPDPDYHKFDWYRSGVLTIEKYALLLEKTKASDMEHWKDEPVNAGFSWDYTGYYDEHYHPISPMRRSDAYKTYNVNGVECKLSVYVPDNYDFTSKEVEAKMLEGAFVLDANSKTVVPLNQCYRLWTVLNYGPRSVYERFVANFARTGYVYKQRK
jgi:hypothetical protein